MKTFFTLAIALVAMSAMSQKISVLSEGNRDVNFGVLIDTPAELVKNVYPDSKAQSTTNAFLVKSSAGHNVLIDTGYGREIFAAMAAQGVNADQVDAILITHLHGDHTGGLLRDGKVAFPNAKLLISNAEYNYWFSADAPESRAEGVRKAVEPYRSQLVLFDAESKPVFDEIVAIPCYGHTPGHTVYQVDNTVIAGDMVHVSEFQFRYPTYAVTYDTNPAEAIASRLKLLSYIANNKLLMVGMHTIGTISLTPSFNFEVR